MKTAPSAATHELFRGVVKDELVSIPFTASGQQATRLAACTDGSFAFATGTYVYRLDCLPTRKRARIEEAGEQLTDSTYADCLSGGVASAVSSAIADDYMVPRPFSSLKVASMAIHSAHSSEVQSVVADDTRIASVDAYGRCIVTLEGRAQKAEELKSELSDMDRTNFVLSPISLSNGGRGWSGVALARNNPAAVVVGRQLFRDVTVFDLEVPVRTIRTILAPQAVNFCGTGATVAVAESTDLTMYDCRAGEKGGCVMRKPLSPGHLLSMDVAGDGGIIATGGTDRVLNVFDTRTMTVRDRWSACLKYECAGTVLSRAREGMAYVCSVDNEVAFGAWSGEMAEHLKGLGHSRSLMISGANTRSARRALGFRADVRLTGMARRDESGEEVAVMSEAGAFYLLRRKPD